MIEAQRILVPVTGSDADVQAVRLACAIARKTKARLFVLHVLEVDRSLPLDSPPDADVREAEAVLERTEEIAKEQRYPIEAEILQAREAGPAVVAEATERHADLIVMGVVVRKHRGEYSIGTTVPYVLLRAPCQVLVSRQPIRDASDPALQSERRVASLL